MSALGALGAAIAALGLYGVMTYVVAQRRREFGILKALGASNANLYTLVLRDGLRMLLIGIAPGLLIAFLAAGSLAHLLYGITAHDAVTFVAVPTVLLCVGLAAAMGPARRAASVDPSVALREL
jgi:ABC-type antimicrobial peptide transport system permease subunit